MTAPASLIDRAIARVSPAWGLKRLQARMRLEMASQVFGVGGYTGARSDRQQLKNWRPLIDGPNSATLPDLRPLRARTADLERNDPVARGATNTMVTSVVGSGLRAHARVDRDYLGLTDDEADALDRQIDRIYTAHAESKYWDFENRLNAYSQQSLGFRSMLGRGDVFLVRRFVEDTHPFATRFQLIEADRVSTPDGMLEGPELLDGIELDPITSAAVAVHILDQHPAEYRYTRRAKHWTRVEVYGRETGAWRVLQLYTMERPSQVRGVPLLAGVIEILKQLSRLSEAELMASVINALFTVFIKTEDDGEGAPMLADMLTGSPREGQAAPAAIADDRAVNLGAGAVVQLLRGEDIQVADPKRPNANYDPFFTACVLQIGAALEIPRGVLLKSFNASFSASRAELLEFWRVVTRRRRSIIDDLSAPCREAVIEEAVLRGYLNMPGFFDDPFARRAYCQAEWTGDPMGQLNPTDEATAAEKWIAMGAKTLAEVTAEITGGTWDAKHPQRVKEHRARAEAGLEPAVLSAGRSSQAAPSSPDPDADPDAQAETPPQLPPPQPRRDDDETETEEAA